MKDISVYLGNYASKRNLLKTFFVPLDVHNLVIQISKVNLRTPCINVYFFVLSWSIQVNTQPVHLFTLLIAPHFTYFKTDRQTDRHMVNQDRHKTWMMAMWLCVLYSHHANNNKVNKNKTKRTQHETKSTRKEKECSMYCNNIAHIINRNSHLQ